MFSEKLHIKCLMREEDPLLNEMIFWYEKKNGFNIPLNSNQPLFPIVPFFSYDKIVSTGVAIPVKYQRFRSIRHENVVLFLDFYRNLFVWN